MERYSIPQKEPVSKTPEKNPGFLNQEQISELKKMQERKAHLAKQVAEHKSELQRRADLAIAVEKARAELVRREKLKKIKEKKNQSLKILTSIKNIISGRKLRTAAAIFGLSVGAVAMGNGTIDKMNNNKVTKQEASVENDNETKKLYNEVKEKIDTNFYRDLSESAQLRYISMIVKDIKDKADSIDRHNGVVSDSLDNEYDPKKITLSELRRMSSSANESGGGDYSVPCSVSNACGYDQVMPSAWFPSIHLNPNDTNDIRYFMDHPEKQDEAWDVICSALEPRCGDDDRKFFAGLLQTGTGPDDVGTPRGDIPVDAFGNTVNGYVAKIMPGRNELFAATKNGGRWIVDSERQKKYWVDLNYHKTFEKDIYPVIKNSRNEQWVGPIGKKNIKESQNLAKIFAKELRTADFTEKFNEENEKLIPFKVAHPNDPKIKSKKSYVRQKGRSHKNNNEESDEDES